MNNTLKLFNYIDQKLNHAERMDNAVIAEAMMNQAFGALTFYAEFLLEEGRTEELREIENRWDNEYSEKFYDIMIQGE